MTVITDPSARYYGIAPGERTLLPGDDAQIADSRFDDWLGNNQATRPDSHSVTEASHA